MTPTKLDSRKNLNSFVVSFLFYIHSNKLIFQILFYEVLIVSDCLLLVKLLQEHNFVSFIVKIKLLLSLLPLTLSVPPTDKTQCFDHLCFGFTLQLINGTSRDLQNLLKCFNGTSVDAFFKFH